MSNPNWVKGMQSPNPTGNIKHSQRFKKVDKRSSLEKKIAIYLTKKWGRMIDDIDKLGEKDRVKAFLELMAYSTPKKAAVNPDAITEEQVNQLYDKIIQMNQYGKAL